MFELALEYARQGDSASAIVSAYTGLFRLQWFSFQEEFAPKIIQDVLKIAKRVNDIRIHINLYDTLAYGYAVTGNIDLALEYAQMGLALAGVLGDDTEIGRLALTLAVVYESASAISRSDHYLERARTALEYAQRLIKSPQIRWKEFSFLFQQGVHLYHHEDHILAETVLTRALSEAYLLDRHDWIMATKHALALVLAKLGRYDEARSNLQAAIIYWQQIDNHLEAASALQELGCIENLSGNRKLALQYLLQARILCQQVTPTPRQALILRLIQETIDEVHGQ